MRCAHTMPERVWLLLCRFHAYAEGRLGVHDDYIQVALLHNIESYQFAASAKLQCLNCCS